MTTNNTLKDIEELQQKCEQHDGISLKLNWESLRLGSAPGGAEWLVSYEDGLLVGFIGLYAFGSEVEVCGMVRPGYRRRGIFTKLWNQALDIIKSKGLQKILLNTPGASTSGLAFLATLPLTFSHAEYQMKWDGEAAKRYGGGDSSARTSVNLRPARADETSLLNQLDADGFGLTLEEAAELNKHDDAEEHIMLELDGRPVGKMRLNTENNETWIYGFTVDKTLRGLGIGRSALLQTIEREQRNYNGINLEVALDNPNALKLYESCGFVILNKQDYYRFIG
ncbi:GNAT family N-acetyltransferase [Paenibacillus sp. GCM10012306]|uniref:GNAT family N-acetyltransferase n=1 Tax=Paenibacillus sp. GCM10012306 TaxID=3317342 RepID=UPI00360D9A91